MLSFSSDYNTGAHPKILEKLLETNLEHLPGYGEDHYSQEAKEKIKDFFHKEDADIFFLTGGTQTNQIIISTMLAPYQGVIAASTGHVSVHEAGAIEFNGHKVIELPAKEGKIAVSDVRNYLRTFYADANCEHMVQPGMLYVSFPSEYGTLYSKKELQELHQTCKDYHMSFFIDGARLGYGLASKSNDISPNDLANLCDVFYVGGTKVGALCGEAVVFTHHNIPQHFLTQVKQHGALLAKGRLNGIQFDALFTDDLYMKISKHAIEMSEKLKQIFESKGYRFFLNSPTNQQFFIIENKKLEEIAKHVEYGFWEKYDDTHTVVRFATSWSTKENDLKELEKIL